ncbi:MAG: glycosyltransferase family 39 protein [Pirellulaceae bacterium]|nr:glycosyltransferase family 39 protein [Planctomycetales bacterium]
MNGKFNRNDLYLALAISVIWVAVSIATRPLIPIDETRYVTVAWEMYQSGDFLVPHLNGEIYSHKPPLLFWLINAVWAVTGVQEGPARCIGPAFGLASLGMVYYLGRLLWPDQRKYAAGAVLVLASSAVWAVFASVTMFDTGLTFFVLCGCVGILEMARQRNLRGFLYLVLAVAGGLLQKGPVIFLHLMPIALLAPKWLNTSNQQVSWRRWYATIFAASGVGIAIALLWVVPAIIGGGHEYAEAILWRQSAGRVVNSFAHRRPFWWYAPLLPLLIFPWSFSWQPWRMLPSLWHEQPIRFCVYWFGATFFLFSLLSGKQIHYLLPALPAAALIVSRLLDTMTSRQIHRMSWQTVTFLILAATALSFLPIVASYHGKLVTLTDISPLWGIPLLFVGIGVGVLHITTLPAAVRCGAVSTIVAFIMVNSAAFSALRGGFDLQPFANDLAEYQTADHPMAFVGNYHGQFHFLGRLDDPITQLDSEAEIAEWSQAHPNGFVIRCEEPMKRSTRGLIVSRELLRDLKSRRLELWDAAALAELTQAELRTARQPDVTLK